jgi:hypothetical protein
MDEEFSYREEDAPQTRAMPVQCVVHPSPRRNFDRLCLELGRDFFPGHSGDVLVRQEEHVDVDVVLVEVMPNVIPVFHKLDKLREVLDVERPQGRPHLLGFLERG